MLDLDGPTMLKTIITIEHTENGQPRPYADSRYSATIKAERHGVYTNGRIIPAYLNVDTVKQLARRFVHGWVDRPDWWQSRLERIQPVKPRTIAGEERSGEWTVTIIQPFLD